MEKLVLFRSSLVNSFRQGEYLAVYPSSCPNMDTVQQHTRQYRRIEWRSSSSSEARSHQSVWPSYPSTVWPEEAQQQHTVVQFVQWTEVTVVQFVQWSEVTVEQFVHRAEFTVVQFTHLAKVTFVQFILLPKVTEAQFVQWEEDTMVYFVDWTKVTVVQFVEWAEVLQLNITVCIIISGGVSFGRVSLLATGLPRLVHFDPLCPIEKD